MANDYFQLKQFTVWQHGCAMKVCTDSCILGAYAAEKIKDLPNDECDILDAGGGTGLLSLMLAQKTNARISAVELEATAATRMSENFKASPWSNRLIPVHGDVRTAGNRKYDFIISNPPFYENDLKTPDESKKLAHHDSGLLLSELVNVLVTRLKAKGSFCIMVPFERTEYIKHLLSEGNLGIYELLTIRHSSRHQPFRTIILGGTSPCSIAAEKFLDIRGEDEYTENFKQLLRDYYLNL